MNTTKFVLTLNIVNSFNYKISIKTIVITKIWKKYCYVLLSEKTH